MDTVNMEDRQPNSERGYHHGDLRRTIISAAIRLLDEGGIDAVTIREVARRARVAHSAPANHFRDRKALLTALAIEITHEVADALRLSIERIAEQRSRLKAAMTATLSYALAHPHRYRLVNRHDILDLADGALIDVQQEIFDVMAAGVQPPERLAYDRDSYVIAVWSLVHGYVSLRLDGTLTTGVDEVAGDWREFVLIDLLIDGVGR
jgi:AcrR family transcriptional regulator